MPSKPEKSISYLLHAYRYLEDLRDNVYIVPVILTYDRIFELPHIAKEMMMTNQSRQFPVRTLIGHVPSVVPEKLGDVYVKYCPPISISDFLKERDISSLTPQQIPKVAI